MTSKHFVSLAKFIMLNYDRFGDSAVNALAEYLELTYPNFNRTLWIGFIALKHGPHGGPRPKIVDQIANMRKKIGELESEIAKLS